MLNDVSLFRPDSNGDIRSEMNRKAGECFFQPASDRYKKTEQVDFAKKLGFRHGEDSQTGDFHIGVAGGEGLDWNPFEIDRWWFVTCSSGSIPA